MSATTNVEQVVRDISAFVRDVQDVAATRAVNKLIEQAETAGVREVAAEYGLTQRDFRQYLRLVKARQGETQAATVARGRGLPVYLFRPRPTSKGVVVRIKRRSVLIPGAFIARMRSGRVGVFARGSYGGKGLVGRTTGTFGRFVFHTGRKVRRPDGSRVTLPINEVYTFGPAEAWASERVTSAMADRVEEQMGKVMRQEIRFASRKS